MDAITKVFENNRRWAAERIKKDPQFFDRLTHLQNPRFLWIGCSDSRVPANEITGLLPGEIFVHRNIANVVSHTDLNGLSVLQYAVDALKVRHVIVCGHYGCGGVQGVFEGTRLGLINNWLKLIEEVRVKHQEELDQLTDTAQQFDRLCELNALEQAARVRQTTVFQDAQRRGQEVTVHAWIYRLKDGRLKDLSSEIARR